MPAVITIPRSALGREPQHPLVGYRRGRSRQSSARPAARNTAPHCPGTRQSKTRYHNEILDIHLLTHSSAQTGVGRWTRLGGRCADTGYLPGVAIEVPDVCSYAPFGIAEKTLPPGAAISGLRRRSGKRPTRRTPGPRRRRTAAGHFPSHRQVLVAALQLAWPSPAR